MSSTPVLAVAAFKGGAGKTSVTVNLAGALAAAGHRVLVVDADPQSAATDWLGAEAAKPTLYEVMRGEAPTEAAVRRSTTTGIDVLVTDLDLSMADLELASTEGWDRLLRTRLDQVLPRYDVVLIDSGPGLTPLAYSALRSADQALLVVRPRFGDVRALHMAYAAANRAQRPVLGLVVNQVARDTTHQKLMLAEILEVAGASQLLGEVPERIAVPDAAGVGKPVSQYAPASDAAAAYAALAAEVITRLGVALAVAR
jgi:chromosome partitioning protein